MATVAFLQPLSLRRPNQAATSLAPRCAHPPPPPPIVHSAPAPSLFSKTPSFQFSPSPSHVLLRVQPRPSSSHLFATRVVPAVLAAALIGTESSPRNRALRLPRVVGLAALGAALVIGGGAWGAVGSVGLGIGVGGGGGAAVALLGAACGAGVPLVAAGLYLGIVGWIRGGEGKRVRVRRERGGVFVVGGREDAEGVRER